MKRLHYIDWLRVIAVFALFPFHAARVFNVGEPFYAKSQDLSFLLSMLIGWMSLWLMPLFFLLAGCSAYFALRKRTAGQFARERVLRLMVPFLFGVLVLMPPQTWYGAQTNAGYTGSLWQYLSSGAWLDTSRLLGPNLDYFGGFGLGQMWFVLWLFVLSLVALPIFLWLRPGKRGARWATGIARRIGRPSNWWWPPLLMVLAAAPPAIGDRPTFVYLALMLLGYCAMADDRFTQDAARSASWAFAGGLVLSALTVVLWPWNDTLPDPSVGRALHELLAMASTWLLLLGGMGLGIRFLGSRNRALDYLAPAGYPVYILHQTVIVALAFYLVQLPIGWPGQYALIVVTSLVVTFALYDGARRVGFLRFLFGMKPKAKPMVVEVEGTGEA